MRSSQRAQHLPQGAEKRAYVGCRYCRKIFSFGMSGMNALRISRNATPGRLLSRSAASVHALPAGQRCVRMIPQARVKEQEELGLVLSDLEREYFREVGTPSNLNIREKGFAARP